MGRLLRRLGEHLTLVGISLAAAILVAIPLGGISPRRPRLGPVILSATGVIPTIPSLALLVFMIPWLGIGAKPALGRPVPLQFVARSFGIRPRACGTFPASLRESAEAMGLPARARLTHRTADGLAEILAGIKTAAVINVGTATTRGPDRGRRLRPTIFTGIRRDDRADDPLRRSHSRGRARPRRPGGVDLAEQCLVPKGLRASKTIRY